MIRSVLSVIAGLCLVAGVGAAPLPTNGSATAVQFETSLATSRSNCIRKGAVDGRELSGLRRFRLLPQDDLPSRGRELRRPGGAYEAGTGKEKAPGAAGQERVNQRPEQQVRHHRRGPRPGPRQRHEPVLPQRQGQRHALCRQLPLQDHQLADVRVGRPPRSVLNAHRPTSSASLNSSRALIAASWARSRRVGRRR